MKMASNTIINLTSVEVLLTLRALEDFAEFSEHEEDIEITTRVMTKIIVATEKYGIDNGDIYEECRG